MQQNPYLLVVEDTKSHIMIAEYALSKLNVDAVYVEDGITAMEMVAQSKPDLMLLDLWLPGANGEAVLEHAHTLYGAVGINTIIMSSQTMAIQELKSRFPYIHGYLIKPYVPQKLIDTVSSLLLTYHDSDEEKLRSKHTA